MSLASNGFSGTLSPSITKLKFLASLDFQDNSLTGLLPIYLANMTHLQNLNLANNNFRGPIPNTWGQLSNLKHLVLRGNHISGHIPDSLSNISGLTELFTGARLACGSVLRVSTKKSKLGTVITSASCGVTVILLIGALFAYRYYRMHKLTHDVFVDVTGEDECKISFGQLRRFSWREIQLATDNFDESNIIGQGGFGRVYKGVLSDNVKVAVKRLTDYNSPGGEAAFLREVQLISVAVHKNLLRLIGFCTTSSERILVYPFMKNLSVAYRLREYLSTGKSSEKTDVFGYGITLLELVTGQRAIDFARLEEEEDVLLLDHIKKLQRENRLDDIVDGHMKMHDPKEVETVIQVALLCTQSSPEDRPTMAQVVRLLQGVDLAEWEQLEDVRNREFSLLSHHQFAWAEESTHDQEAIQLSKAR
ncbi:hypothetical protein L3X38_026128 [Prunus dulcis]|uniref:non-specific serine/threonine protein kinase n=1 Tax=Prunus dulcis TaxID=3755 RepID=A0AAD4Z825_PRUDU|nr:hypothetical protein L3X38_026128 [Prunus dulcis]